MSSQSRLGERGKSEKPSAALATRVLLVGHEGVALRGAVEKLLLGEQGIAVETADSILEAVLMSDGANGAGSTPDIGAVLAEVSQEIEQIEPAVRSLAKMYGHSRIVLLCDPSDETVCRKAKSWGAADYLILPIDGAGLRTALTVSKSVAAKVIPSEPERIAEPIKRRAIEEPSRTAPADLLDRVVKMQAVAPLPAVKTSAKETNGHGIEFALPGLPLMVQTVLLNDLLAGRADFADRVIATLESYVKWGGRLRFVPAKVDEGAMKDEPENALQLRARVELLGQSPFGVLILDLKQENLIASTLLQQAAQWLASLLSVSRRYEQLRSLAITDELSGAYNRRYFTKFMSGLLERARLNRFRVTLLMFDIDDFKKYNDTFGHASGDAIIRELIKLLRACTRPHDLVARIGGDEFAVVYWDNEAPRQPNSEHPKDVLGATERFRKAIKNHAWSEACKIKGEVSISGGLATFPWDADTLEMLMSKADQALLKAKAAGKNVIVIHERDAAEACEIDMLTRRDEGAGDATGGAE